MNIRNGFLVAAFVVTGGVTAGPAAAADSGPYIGIAAGQSKANLDEAEINASLAALGLGGTTSIDDTGNSFKVYGGYQVNRNFALELGYVNFGKVTSDSVITSGGSGTLAGEWKASSIDFSVLGILPLGESATLFGRAGLGAWKLDVDFTATGPGGVGNASDSESGVSPLLGIGAAFYFTPKFALRAEYERHFSVGDDDTTGKSDIDMVTVGVQFHF